MASISTVRASPAVGRCSSLLRSLPSEHAVFGSRFVFTTLTPKEVEMGPYGHPNTGKPLHLFTSKFSPMIMS
jgi:hypothetical protein